jgi:hypothetical protein
LEHTRRSTNKTTLPEPSAFQQSCATLCENWKKKTASSTNGVGKTAHLKVKQDPSLTLYKKPTQNESKTAM